MSDILSKVTASGLSAGIFLLWWPAHITSQGSEALLARGVLWALAFEILLLGFRPLERTVERAVRTRETEVLAPRRIAPLLAMAAVAAVVPVTMLCGERAPIAASARAAAPKVIVKREIVRREVVVKRVSHVVRVPAPAAAPVPPTAAPVTRVVRTAAAQAAPATTVKKAATTPKPPAADTKSDAPSSTSATTAKPAVTTAATQPTTAATPSATTAATTAAATPPAGE